MDRNLIRALTVLAALLACPAARAQPAPPAFPPGFEQAYRAYIAGLPPAGRSLSWLTRFDAVASQAAPLTMGGQTLTYLFACKAHACDTDNVNLFLLPDRKQARAVVRINGAQILTGGAGAAEVACVKKLDAGGVASAC